VVRTIAAGPLLGVVAVEAPLPRPRFRLDAVVPKATLMDDRIVWVLDRRSGNAGNPG